MKQQYVLIWKYQEIGSYTTYTVGPFRFLSIFGVIADTYFSIINLDLSNRSLMFHFSTEQSMLILLSVD